MSTDPFDLTAAINARLAQDSDKARDAYVSMAAEGQRLLTLPDSSVHPSIKERVFAEASGLFANLTAGGINGRDIRAMYERGETPLAMLGAAAPVPDADGHVDGLEALAAEIGFDPKWIMRVMRAAASTDTRTKGGTKAAIQRIADDLIPVDASGTPLEIKDLEAQVRNLTGQLTTAERERDKLKVDKDQLERDLKVIEGQKDRAERERDDANKSARLANDELDRVQRENDRLTSLPGTAVLEAELRSKDAELDSKTKESDDRGQLVVKFRKEIIDYYRPQLAQADAKVDKLVEWSRKVKNAGFGSRKDIIGEDVEKSLDDDDVTMALLVRPDAPPAP